MQSQLYYEQMMFVFIRWQLWGVQRSWELQKYRISQSEILFSTVVSGKSHLESRGFAKHIENGESDVTDRKSNLIGNFVLFFFYFLIVLLDICG